MDKEEKSATFVESGANSNSESPQDSQESSQTMQNISTQNVIPVLNAKDLCKMASELSTPLPVSIEGSPPQKASCRKRQGALSIQNKLAILNAVDKGDRRKSVIASDFGIPSSTLSTILKQRDKITEACRDLNLNRKRLRLPQYADLDKLLAEWCKDVQSGGVKLSGSMVHEKSKEMAAALNYPQFLCSNGWMSRFKERHGISFGKNAAERNNLKHVFQHAIVNFEVEANNVRKPTCTDIDLTQIIPTFQDFQNCDVFCVISFPLFWSALPPNAFPKVEKILEDHHQEHVTVILACNMDGSKKLPLHAIIDKSKQCLNSLVDVRNKCSVQYTYNDSASLTPDIFVQWIQHVDTMFDIDNRQVCFLVEQNKIVHPQVELKAIKVELLPKDWHSHLQSIATYLKIAYRLKLVELLGTSTTDSLNITEALNVLHQQWKAVPTELIKQSFTEASNEAFRSVEVPLSSNTRWVSDTEHLKRNSVISSTHNKLLLQKIKSEVTWTPEVQKACFDLGIGSFGSLDQMMDSQRSSFGNSQHVLDVNSPDYEVPPSERQANEAVETLKKFFDSRCISNASVAHHLKESLGIIENSLRVLPDL